MIKKCFQLWPLLLNASLATHAIKQFIDPRHSQIKSVDIFVFKNLKNFWQQPYTAGRYVLIDIISLDLYQNIQYLFP